MAFARIGFKLAVLLVMGYLISQSGTAVIPIFIAVIAAFILHPLVRFLAGLPMGHAPRKLGVPAAIFCAFLLAGVLLTGVMMVLVAPLFEEFANLYRNIPQILTGIQMLLVEIENNILLPLAKSGLYERQSEQVTAFLQQAIAGSLTFSLNMLKSLAALSMHVVSKVIGLIVVPVLTFYLLKDWRYLVASFLHLFSPKNRKQADEIVFEMGQVVSDFLRGQFLLCLIIGSCMFVGLYAMDIEYPLVLALLAGIAEAIPIVGPIISAVPAILLGLIVSPYLGIKVAVFCFFLQQVENHILVPKVMGGSVNLHPVVVIVSILIAGQFLGIIGMIAALPTAALFKVLMKHFWITEEKK